MKDSQLRAHVCRQNHNFGDFTLSLCRGPKIYLLKSVLHVHSTIIYALLTNDIIAFVELLLPSPSSFLKLPNTEFKGVFD